MSRPNEIDLRAKYLSDASQYLMAASPSSSACVMAERLEMMNTNTTPLDPSKSPTICIACGTRLLPGLTSRVSVHPRRSSTKQTHNMESNTRRKAMPLITIWQEECWSCRRVTSTELAKSTRSEITRHVAQSKKPAKQPDATSTGHRVGISTQATNKKRKKHKGLLVRLKEEGNRTTSSPELALMDFMKAV